MTNWVLSFLMRHKTIVAVLFTMQTIFAFIGFRAVFGRFFLFLLLIGLVFGGYVTYKRFWGRRGNR